MQAIGQHLTQEAIAARSRLELAEKLLKKARSRQEEIVALRQEWQSRIWFNAAEPMEPLNLKKAIARAPESHTVVATDGSQIAPSHHEIAYCYLINVGRVMLHYGQSRHPLLDSVPEVFYRSEDLYVSRQWGIRTEEWMGYRRTVSEIEALADLAVTYQLDSNSKRVPILAMVDGSLIYWFLETLPSEACDRILPPILEAWEQLRLAGIPLVGYLSASRSSDATHFLRFQACPKPEPNCLTHCPNKGISEGGIELNRAPCQKFEPLRDVTLWSVLLEPGRRGNLWRSSSPILSDYGDRHHIYFCYVHVGTEIARLEMPAWVAEDAKLLETTLSLVVAQVQKGYGYPVTLAEAHNQAVVRGGDRHRFFSILERQMIKSGLRNVGTSYKETRKRGSIA